ncbi:prolyl oligopeptidase family serine peptidase [Haliscomenobacter sp.]|uniref:S9 family peptidase n=1 Tax=Haliscomenobacter sp. TaxID=2717303 RepID=UPI003364DD8F
MKKILFLLTFLIGTLSCNQKPTENPPRNVKKYTIEQFYANINIGGGSFSPDESKLLVSSNESGIYNLYEINLSDQSMTAVTKSTTESLFGVDYVPGTGEILYAADKGGNEIDHLYLRRVDGTVQDLTPAPKEKANFFGWSEDKKSMYYTSNKRDERFFDLYKMIVGTWKAQMLFQNNEGYEVAGISWDEKTIALTKSITTSENQLFLYDLASKKTTEISKADKKGTYNVSGFSKDGKTFTYLSNAGKEFQELEQYTLSGGQYKTLYATKWDVMYAYDSENEKYRVIGINVDGKNQLKVLDNQTGKALELPEIPDGDVIAVNISPSETKMRLTVGTSKAPSNLYLYDFKTKALTKLTETLNKELNAENLVSAEVVRYKSFDGLDIPAIYYKPQQASAQNKVPGLIWVHGGPGGQSRVGYIPLVQYLVNHGYAVLAVNNRGSSGYGQKFYKMDDRNHGEKDLQDCVWGKKYLQSLAYIDSEKIGIIGGSYGGYMTMAGMTFTPDEFKVGVDIFGVTNWLRTLKSIPPYWESFRSALYSEMGDPFTGDSVRLSKISPLFHTEKVKSPIMVLQGANDPRVLQVESDEIVAKVKNNKVPVEYIVFPDEGHGFVKKENEIKGYGAVLKFLDKYLKEEKEIKN